MTSAQKYTSFVWIVLLLSISILFFNVLVVDIGLYHSNQMGQILFFAQYFCLLSTAFIAFLLVRLNQKTDLLSVLVFLFALWIGIRGKTGGLLYDEKFFYFSGCLAFFFITRSLFKEILINEPERSQNYILIVVISIVVIASIEAVIGQLQAFDLYPSYHQNYKVTGTFFNPALFAGFLVACLPWSLYLSSLRKDNLFLNILSWAGYISTVLIITVLPSTYSRASYLAFGTAILIWVHFQFTPMLYLNNILHNRKRKAMALVFFSLVFFSACIGLYNLKSDSAIGRTLIWKVSLSLARENFFFGSGFNTFQAVFGPKQIEYFDLEQRSSIEERVAGGVQWAFNEPIQIFIELGLIGGSLVLAIFFYVFVFKPRKNLVKEQSPFLIASRASFGGLVVFGFFSYPFYSLPCTLIFFFSLAVISSFSPVIGNQALAWILNGVTLAFIVFISYYYFSTTHKVDAAYNQWAQARQLYDHREYKLATERFSHLMPILKGNGLFLLHYGKSLAMAQRYQEAVDVLSESKAHYVDEVWYITMGNCHEMLGNFRAAEKYYKHAASMIPHRFYPKYLLGLLYDKFGENEQALQVARDLIRKKAKVESRAIKEIRVVMQEIVNRHEKEFTKTGPK